MIRGVAILIHILMQLGANPTVANISATNIYKHSKRYNINPYLVTAVIKHENSRLKPRAINRKSHDYGFMQIHCPSRNYAWWCKDMKKLMHLGHNIKTGIYLLYLKKIACVGKHKHKAHWIKHNNWNSKGYGKKVLAIYRKIQKMVREYKERLEGAKHVIYNPRSCWSTGPSNHALSSPYY